MNDTFLIHRILNSPNRMYASSPGPDMSVRDALELGFSYVENQDNMVRYVVVGPDMMKRIFCEIPESKMDLDGQKIGDLWTADLLFSKKIRSNRIIFSNHEIDTVLILDTVHKIISGASDAAI